MSDDSYVEGYVPQSDVERILKTAGPVADKIRVQDSAWRDYLAGKNKEYNRKIITDYANGVGDPRLRVGQICCGGSKSTDVGSEIRDYEDLERERAKYLKCMQTEDYDNAMVVFEQIQKAKQKMRCR